jgi:hypothetical protein
MTTKIMALISLCPGAAWSWHGDDYAGLEWLDANQQKPSEKAINDEVVRLQSVEPNRLAEQNRLAAYRNESDPLFFKAQRGEATMEEWKAKIAEIKLRYPKA